LQTPIELGINISIQTQINRHSSIPPRITLKKRRGVKKRNGKQWKKKEINYTHEMNAMVNDAAQFQRNVTRNNKIEMYENAM
jgi:hypothetical protein